MRGLNDGLYVVLETMEGSSPMESLERVVSVGYHVIVPDEGKGDAKRSVVMVKSKLRGSRLTDKSVAITGCEGTAGGVCFGTICIGSCKCNSGIVEKVSGQLHPVGNCKGLGETVSATQFTRWFSRQSQESPNTSFASWCNLVR